MSASRTSFATGTETNAQRKRVAELPSCYAYVQRLRYSESREFKLVLERKVSLLTLWAGIIQFPLLCPVAMPALSSACSSAACVISFSAQCSVHSKLRNRLYGDCVGNYCKTCNRGLRRFSAEPSHPVGLYSRGGYIRRVVIFEGWLYSRDSHQQHKTQTDNFKRTRGELRSRTFLGHLTVCIFFASRVIVCNASSHYNTQQGKFHAVHIGWQHLILYFAGVRSLLKYRRATQPRSRSHTCHRRSPCIEFCGSADGSTLCC